MDELASGTELREALARPASYAHPAPSVEVRETHISWVFLAGRVRVLVLDFLDYGTPQRRRAMFEAEVRLNRRLAAGIHLGCAGSR